MDVPIWSLPTDSSVVVPATRIVDCVLVVV